ncbi:MAG: orotidine-5'-phosphate decarboxylase [Acidobacteriota bacterium]
MSKINAADHLIVALDFERIEQAKPLVKALDGLVHFFKIGIGLQLEPGVNEYIRELIADGKKVFLDYKYLDIEETVERAVRQAVKIGVSFITVHGYSSIIAAAARARGDSPLKLFSVTVLTSLDATDIHEMGFDCSVEDLVLHRARRTVQWGCDGVIASGHEAALIREQIGKNLVIITPGIRRDTDERGDQKRAMSPARAIEAGADYLVVGRPIIASPDPIKATKEILAEMQAALESRANTVLAS